MQPLDPSRTQHRHEPENTPKQSKNRHIPVPGPQSQPLAETPINKRSLATSSEKLQLNLTKDKIRTLSSPLLPNKGTTANDLYDIQLAPTTTFIFKPGKTNSLKAILCSKIAKVIGLESSVLKTVQATAAQVLSKHDLDDAGKPIKYLEATINDKAWIVHPKDHMKIRSIVETEDGDKVTLEDGSEEGLSFLMIPEGDGYRLEELLAEDSDEDDFEPSDFDDQTVMIATTIEGQDSNDEYMVLTETAYPIVEGEEPFIERGDARLHLKTSDEFGSEGIMLVRNNVEGLVQQKVENVVTHLGASAIDIVKSAPDVKAAFFSMINPISFIDSVVLSMLFRTQDGKATDLEDTNFLFTKENDQLNLVMIDLDETWPTSNDLTDDPELRKHGDIAALRLGLMGYPQALSVLEAAPKAHLMKLLTTLKNDDTKRALLATVDKYEGTPNKERVKDAFKEVLDKLNTFDTSKDFRLLDLVFHVFPEYQKQWMQLEALKFTPAEIATSIGHRSVEEAKSTRRSNKENKI